MSPFSFFFSVLLFNFWTTRHSANEEIFNCLLHVHSFSILERRERKLSVYNDDCFITLSWYPHQFCSSFCVSFVLSVCLFPSLFFYLFHLSILQSYYCCCCCSATTTTTTTPREKKFDDERRKEKEECFPSFALSRSLLYYRFLAEEKGISNENDGRHKSWRKIETS